MVCGGARSPVPCMKCLLEILEEMGAYDALVGIKLDLDNKNIQIHGVAGTGFKEFVVNEHLKSRIYDTAIHLHIECNFVRDSLIRTMYE
mmetsp:Transcript_30364/g.30675  ORF Transcript_30364/g.30675 Transcript_30364/m.30675 type:complete len:89 (+) Transcript_30364:403-669(+)